MSHDDLKKLFKALDEAGADWATDEDLDSFLSRVARPSWYWCPGCGPSVRCACGATACGQWQNHTTCNHAEAGKMQAAGLCPRWMRYSFWNEDHTKRINRRPNKHLRGHFTRSRRRKKLFRPTRVGCCGENLYRKKDRSMDWMWPL